MKKLRTITAIALSAVMVLIPTGCFTPRVEQPVAPLTPEAFDTIQGALRSPYWTLFERATTLDFTEKEIERVKAYLADAEDYCVARLERLAKNHDEEIRETQQALRNRTSTLSEGERHNLHCNIQNARILKKQVENLAEHAIPVAYDNREAKLRLIQEWPKDLKRFQSRITSGEYHSREFGDIKDIGVRAVGEGQEDDIDDGQKAIEEMRRNDVLPPEIKNDHIQDYVTNLARNIAAKSDLRVPVKIRALNAKEINAFALPGGFLFVQRGLLEAAEDEAQLAGVIAHEIAHAAARHGRQLMRQATISQILYQVAQVAGTVLTGGAAGIGTYYALQYGFYGLGLVLDLNLLGVSRDFELEADQLGVQYAWNTGYDPSGFIRFFDKMATTKGYVDGASWFRTHPPFYERMVRSKEEMLYLPEKKGLIRNSAEFERMKQELARVSAEAAEEEENRPSLLAPEQGCPSPQKIEYKSGQPIEAICSQPTT